MGLEIHMLSTFQMKIIYMLMTFNWWYHCHRMPIIFVEQESTNILSWNMTLFFVKYEYVKNEIPNGMWNTLSLYFMSDRTSFWQCHFQTSTILYIMSNYACRSLCGYLHLCEIIYICVKRFLGFIWPFNCVNYSGCNYIISHCENLG